MTEVDRIWYLRRTDGEGSVGPFSTEQLRDQWEKGLLEESTEGWKEGMPDWRPLAEIEPFATTARVPSDAPGIVRFSCECGNQIVMSDKFIGRLAKCKICGRTVTVCDPSQLPEPEPRKQKKKKEEEGRPMWVVPVAAVAGLIIIAGAITYFAVSGSAEEGPVAVAPQDRGSRIARARNEIIDDIIAPEPKRKVRPTAKLAEEPQEAPKEADQELVHVGEGTRDTGQTAAGADEEAKNTGQTATDPDTDQDPSTTESEPDDEPAEITGGPEERAVRNLAREFAEAFRTKNPTPIERLEELLADDCVVVPATGGLVEGKELNMQAFTQTIAEKAQRFRNLRVRYAISWIRVFSDSAVMCGELTEQGTLKARGKPSKEVFWTTLVFQKTEEQWRIIQVHYTPVARRHGPAG